jgi:signal peptidase I
LLGLVVLAGAGYPFFLFASGRVTTFEIDGPSMEPTLMEGERVFVDTRLDRPLARGDLVVFHNPTLSLQDEVLVKRLVALPGDRVEILSHRLFVNGVREHRSGLGQLRVPVAEDKSFELGPEEIYVLGDNRRNSHDSTEFDALPVSAVEGRLTFCYWPPSHLRHVN